MQKDAIGILIDLARRGEIDPWDIDVVQLTDRFVQSLGRLDPRDLPRTGQAILYASILVGMKAELLENRLNSPETLEAAPPEEELEEATPRLPLERLLRRRPAVPAMADRPLTLKDLIAHLRAVERLERRVARERSSERMHRLKGVSVQTMAEVEQLAHHENLEAVIAELGQWLTHLATDGGPVRFEFLLEHYRDRVGAFLGLLFLAHRSQVILGQSEFYQDIAVYAVQPEDTSGSGTLP